MITFVSSRILIHRNRRKSNRGYRRPAIQVSGIGAPISIAIPKIVRLIVRRLPAGFRIGDPLRRQGRTIQRVLQPLWLARLEAFRHLGKV